MKKRKSKLLNKELFSISDITIRIKHIVYIIAIFFVPILIIHVLFKIKTNIYILQAEWEPGDILNYIISFYSFLGTILLGYIAVRQTKCANDLSNKMADIEMQSLKLEKVRHRPRIDISRNLEYELYFGDSISEAREKLYNLDVLTIEPRFIPKERTGILSTVALMTIEIVNNSDVDIQDFYLNEMEFFISCNQPSNQQSPFVMGDKFIPAHGKRNLVIDFRQEFDLSEGGEDEVVMKQLKWISESNYIMPHFDMEFHIITVEGLEYKECLSLVSSQYQSDDTTSDVRKRVLGVSDIKITELTEN